MDMIGRGIVAGRRDAKAPNWPVRLEMQVRVGAALANIDNLASEYAQGYILGMIEGVREQAAEREGVQS